MQNFHQDECAQKIAEDKQKIDDAFYDAIPIISGLYIINISNYIDKIGMEFESCLIIGILAIDEDCTLAFLDHDNKVIWIVHVPRGCKLLFLIYFLL